jgi:uncharacterized protein (TIGR00369 family)
VSSATGGAAAIGSSRLIEARDGRRYAFADHNCFACGGANPIGMHLSIELGEGTATSTWVPGPNFEGWEEKVHGGVLATLLDEVMAWAPSSFDSWAVTAEISIRYRSPAEPGQPLTARGWVTERRRRIYQVRGEIRDGEGRLIAEAQGRFLGASPTVKAQLKARYGLPAEVTGAAPQPNATKATRIR